MSDVVTKSYFQQRQRNRLYETIIKAVEASGMRQRDIAEKLNVSPSQISHFLSGPANWTIDNVSDVLFAIDAELDFSVVKFQDRKKGDRYHDLNGIPPKLAETRQRQVPARQAAPRKSPVVTSL